MIFLVALIDLVMGRKTSFLERFYRTAMWIVRKRASGSRKRAVAQERMRNRCAIAQPLSISFVAGFLEKSALFVQGSGRAAEGYPFAAPNEVEL